MTTDTPAAAAITAEREAFEAWMASNLPGIELHWRESDGGEYMLSHAHVAWRAWKGARLSAPVAAPRGTDAQILKERELTASTIRGAMMYGYQGVNPPPDTAAWLREFWDVGAEQRRLEVAAQPAASGVDAKWVEHAMALADEVANSAMHGDDAGVNDAHEALRAHLSTALTGAAKEVK